MYDQHNSIAMGMPHHGMTVFTVQAVHLPDPSDLTSLAETSDGLTWSVQDGAPISLTAVEAATELPDPALLALCIAYGIHVPLDVIRRNPLGVIGHLADLTASPEIIPGCLARRRA